MSKSRRFDPDIYIAVARMLQSGAQASEISRELKISGYTIGEVRELIERGFIEFGEDGEPRWTTSLREVALYLASRRRKGRGFAGGVMDTPREVVASTVMDKTAEEARKRIEAKLTLGEVSAFILEQLRRDGYDPEKYPPERIIPEMYRAWRELPRLRERLEELEELVERYETLYSPLEHARRIIQVMNESAVALALLRRAGFRLSRDSAPVKLYNHLINKFASTLYM